MPDLTDDEQQQVLGEVMSDQLKAILEHLEALSSVPADIKELKENSTRQNKQLEVIEAAIKDMGQHEKSQDVELDNHAQRPTSLEAA